MRKSFLATVFTIILAFQSNAFASACYSATQAEADQAIRIHSELMVIGLNCQHMGKRAGKNLYGTYRQMTATHGDLFAQYEQTLLDFFKSHPNELSPEDNVNALRTKYANDISKDVASMRPDVFCARYAPRVVKAAALSEGALRQWAGTFYEAHPVTYPLCNASLLH